MGSSLSKRKRIPISHKYIPPMPDDFRCGCPALNTLANYGWLPRDGGNITPTMLITAIHDNFGVSWTVAKTMTATAFAQCGRRGVLNLCDLNEHNKAEHDCSLSRDDANLSGGKQSEFSRQRFQKLLTFSDDGVVLTSRDVVKARIFFYDESRMKNPRFTWNIEQEELMLIETVLLLFVLGDNGAISIADAKSFFENEKFPEDWEMRADLTTWRCQREAKMVSGLLQEIRTEQAVARKASLHVAPKPSENVQVV